MGRLSLLGVEVDPLTLSDIHVLMRGAVERDERWIIANHNSHSIYLCHRDAKMRAYYERADVIHVDSMPLIYWGRLLGCRLSREHRVTYVDWVGPLMAEASQRRWKVFYLGGEPGVAERAARVLMGQFPELMIRAHHGHFVPSGPENDRILQEIESFRPQVLMVGMGMPLQEYWVLDNLERIRANTILAAGACFDYVAGATATPPRWTGRLGLEWLYRLYREPQRLWRRYLLQPWSLLGPAVRDIARATRRAARANGGR